MSPPVGLELTEREVGRLVGAAPGPTLVVVAGIHGNEPAGVEAARHVLACLTDTVGLERGELVVLAGHVEGLRAGRRYFHRDLNRQWTRDRLEATRTRARAGGADEDDRELLELHAAVEAAIARARGPVYVADLHTTSAPGIPFVLFGDTLLQRAFVQAFPIPVIIGLEEQVDGVLSDYWTRQGCVTFAVEGGQNEDPGARENLAAIIWLSLDRAGLLPAGHGARVAQSHTLLDARREGLPRVLEVVERRAIDAEDCFHMEPGFRNLNHARRGQLLARDRRGEIRAPSDGVVILPLYQKLGSDGFFWGRTVSETRLRASKVLRTLRAEKLLEVLPGVQRDPALPSRYVVEPGFGRRYAFELLQMLGFRRIRAQQGALVFERQEDRGRR